MAMGQNGAMRMEMSKVTMPAFADLITPFLDRPVVDMTELKGNYQVALELPMEELMVLARANAAAMGVAMPGAGGPGGIAGAAPAAPVASDPSGSGIFQAVQQMGLRLDARKTPVETIVIDKIEKTPSEN